MIIDFRLQVFQTVALQLSFTKAAQLLFISQPSVTKHINELEKIVQRPLFNRHGRRISLTGEGELLLNYTNKIIDLYKRLNEEIDSLNRMVSGEFKIGASTTIAQYILPAMLARFKEAYPEVNLHLLNGNTREIETYVLEKKVALGIIEGRATNPLLHYDPFVEDEIVLVTRQENRRLKKDAISLKELKKLPLVIREKGSGTLAVMLNALAKKGISEKDLQIDMELGSTESVKNYLLHSDAFAFVSIHTVLTELTSHKLKVIELRNLDISRTFQFVSPHGEHSNMVARYKKFFLLHYNL